MKARLAWFTLGFITAIALVSSVNYYRFRPQNAVRNLPKDQQEAMLTMFPWLKTAKAGKLGPFKVIVPASSTDKSQASISSEKGYPQIFIYTDRISIMDSKEKIMSIQYEQSTGEFRYYEYSTNIVKGSSFFDSDLDGQYDVKFDPSYNFGIFYDSKWIPVVRKDKRKYVNIGGAEREIEISKSTWKYSFVK
ncbi:MAG: hypothetical protein HZC51_07300 [Nitrospirae bacterium]|nr:hypothetical protein [Nitrospirota bacterium]